MNGVYFYFVNKLFLIDRYWGFKLLFDAFNDSQRKYFENIVRNREPTFSSLPTMFSTLSKTYSIILNTFNLSAANALNLDKSKINGLIQS